MPVYNYDIRSSFPVVASNLLDIRECNWVQTDHYIDEAIYGYAKCRVTINDDVVVHPILRVAEDGSLEANTGTWPDCLPKCKLDFITKWKIGSWIIEDSWWAVPKNKWKLNKPLEIPVKRLLDYKEQGGLKGMLAKRMSVGNFYGKLGEEWEETFGPHFNPCWFSEISSQVSLEVVSYLYEHGIGPRNNEGYQHLLAIGVDSFMLDCLLEEIGVISNKTETTNFEWRLTYRGEALIVSSGLVFLGERKPKGLYLDDVLQLIASHPKQAYYSKAIMRRVTLGDALARDFSELGRERPMSSSIDLLRGKHDRDFSRLPKTGGQLISKVYKSKPKEVML